MFFIIGVGILIYGVLQMNLPVLADVSPDDQGGNFSTAYDPIFYAYSVKYGVPFALIKAHAIMESSLNPNAFLDESNGLTSRKGWASRGLMQILWWPGSQRFAKYGHADGTLGVDGSIMFDPNVNVDIAAQIIKANLSACRNNIRDAINMYNTGKKEADLEAPGNYVDKVLGYYNTLTNGAILA